MSSTPRPLFRSTLTILVVAWFGVSLAGGPLIIQQSGEPYLWPDGGRNIPFHPDQGGFGPIGNSDVVSVVEAAFGQWEAVASSTIDYSNAGQLALDVDATNFLPFFASSFPDGLNPVIFDQDGSIFRQFFGPRSGVLGFAGPEWVEVDTGNILEGAVFLSGEEFLFGFPLEEAPALFAHEFGHFSNLSHTVVNGQVARFNDQYGPTPFDTFPPQVPADLVETMYPFILIGGGLATPHADDIAILSSLYPEPDFFDSRGSIEGQVLLPDGETAQTGVNVIARNVDDPLADAVSAITGDFSFFPGDVFDGRYRLNGLTPGATYVIYIDRIVAGGFTTPILSPLPGPEELYNGANESGDPNRDDPSEFTGVVPTAGTSTTIDITINALAPGPILLSDDNSRQIFLPFEFQFCGSEYRSVFVNSNGSLSFGGGISSFLESPVDLAAGLPRIAGLWDDLNPTTGGEVSFSQTNNRLSVLWDSVPEFTFRGANTFEITLHRSSNQVDIEWGDMTATDGLAGYSCGGKITTGLEPEEDLSALTGETVNARNRETIWQWFPDDDSDLADLDFRFTAPKEFKDLFEPNDDITHARRTNLPFRSDVDFSEIDTDGGDVDFYRFRVDSGMTLLAETLPGNFLDTYIGLFDVETGELLAADDDSGVGFFSKITHSVEQGGLFALAVTTFPDFDFDGAGDTGGRYAVDLRAIEGLLLPMGDDTSREVAFENFEFPFQGTNWSTVWVNSNGNLTFGQGDTDFTQDLFELLAGPPRIAAMWDDLSPNNGGQVTLSRSPTSLTVRFNEVPEFFRTGANSFAITLHASGDIEISYGETNGNDAVVGVTEGGGVSDPGETDLSAGGTLSAVGTTYEKFIAGELDLDGLTLLFRAVSP